MTEVEPATGRVAELDPRSPLPLWAQLEQQLRNRLAANEFAEHFPTEAELAYAYGISRHTVRDALRRMAADGLVVRRQGRGTTVASREFEQPLRGFYHLADTLRQQGGEERSEVLAAQVGQDDSAASQLGLAPGTEVVIIARLRSVGGDPVALDRSWLPVEPGKRLLGADLSAGSLYDLLAGRAGVQITGGWERIFAVSPSATDRRLLRLPVGSAAFAIQRLALAGGRPVEWRESCIRGDRFCLRADWAEPIR
jgi:GntR family transcriptional regulator